MGFKNLSRGDQFLRLLKIEYLDLLKQARLQVSLITQQLELYKYEDEDHEVARSNLQFYKNSVVYYTEILRDMRGAENEEILTDSVKPETETPQQFKGITCITVG